MFTFYGSLFISYLCSLHCAPSEFVCNRSHSFAENERIATMLWAQFNLASLALFYVNEISKILNCIESNSLLHFDHKNMFFLNQSSVSNGTAKKRDNPPTWWTPLTHGGNRAGRGKFMSLRAPSYDLLIQYNVRAFFFLLKGIFFSLLLSGKPSPGCFGTREQCGGNKCLQNLGEDQSGECRRKTTTTEWLSGVLFEFCDFFIRWFMNI